MRQRHKPWAEDFLKDATDLVISNPQDIKGKWQTQFGNDRPIHLEIGTGKGQFIATMASQYPEINFIGIDQGKSIIATAGSKVRDAGCENVLLILTNATVLDDLFTENEIAAIYLNFSDPWPKKRHAKRRLTYYTFLKQYQHLLQPKGEIVLKTDNQNLFAYSLVSFSQYGLVLNDVNLDLHNSDAPENVMTEYEERFAAKGQPIYRCKAQFV
ncbi:tRNA (guanosine(46)-N7)-methyltransferase TrmB [Barrientosiimonas marina]|uniref:tRNA (guanine-N(7)-)-methyltransferase n=1 Tax=Lentibacillus kimchii TaxID=1542911 RepID=A0ABW2UT16_9BACI